MVGVFRTDLEGVPLTVEGVTRTDLEGVLLGELPSSKRRTLDGVPWPWILTSPFSACDAATFAGVLLGVFRIGLFSFYYHQNIKEGIYKSKVFT